MEVFYAEHTSRRDIDQKCFVILHRPAQGNTLYVYDQNLQLVQDLGAFTRATKLFLTNIQRKPNAALEGNVLFREKLWVSVNINAQFSTACLVSDTMDIAIHDECSLLSLPHSLKQHASSGDSAIHTVQLL